MLEPFLLNVWIVDYQHWPNHKHIWNEDSQATLQTYWIIIGSLTRFSVIYSHFRFWKTLTYKNAIDDGLWQKKLNRKVEKEGPKMIAWDLTLKKGEWIKLYGRDFSFMEQKCNNTILKSVREISNINSRIHYYFPQ